MHLLLPLSKTYASVNTDDRNTIVYWFTFKPQYWFLVDLLMLWYINIVQFSYELWNLNIWASNSNQQVLSWKNDQENETSHNSLYQDSCIPHLSVCVETVKWGNFEKMFFIHYSVCSIVRVISQIIYTGKPGRFLTSALETIT